MRAVADNRDLAESSGIDVQRVMVIGFGLSAVLAGIAGILNAVTFGSTYPFLGQMLGLKGLVILIVAGIGNVRGCLVVALGGVVVGGSDPGTAHLELAEIVELLPLAGLGNVAVMADDLGRRAQEGAFLSLEAIIESSVTATNRISASARG